LFNIIYYPLSKNALIDVFVIGAPRFSYQQLAKATSNFAVDGKLGAGAFGTVYKLNGMDVAVKEIIMPDNNAEQGQVRKDFDNEVNAMSPLHHCNIISFIGCCKDKKNLVLVYELMENGNLEDQLYPKAGAMDSDRHGVTVTGANLMLDWPKRYAYTCSMDILFSAIYVGTPSIYVYMADGIHDTCISRLKFDHKFNQQIVGYVTQK
jgi:hypothetical protein